MNSWQVEATRPRHLTHHQQNGPCFIFPVNFERSFRCSSKTFSHMVDVDMFCPGFGLPLRKACSTNVAQPKSSRNMHSMFARLLGECSQHLWRLNDLIKIALRALGLSTFACPHRCQSGTFKWTDKE